MKKLILLGSLMFMALAAKAQASGAVTLGWTLSVSTSVTNQTLWYGPATGSYTNSLQLGPAVSQFQVTNLVQGGVSDFHRDRRGRLRTVRALRGIDSKVSLNKGLWGLAERLANGFPLVSPEQAVLN